MKKVIHNLRQQSEEVRRHILHSVTLIAGLLLFALWIYSLGTSFREKKEEVKEDLAPLTSIKDNFVNGYQSIKESGSLYDIEIREVPEETEETQ